MNIRIFIDIDGVLAKFNKYATSEQLETAEYYEQLEEDPFAKTLALNLAKKGKKVELFGKFINEEAKRGKLNWIKKVGLDSIPVTFIPYGADKSEYLPRERWTRNILLDDYTQNLREWQRSGNIGVKYLNGINGTNGTWKGMVVDPSAISATTAEDCLCVAGMDEINFVKYLTEKLNSNERSMDEVKQLVHAFAVGFAPRATASGIDFLEKEIMKQI